MTVRLRAALLVVALARGTAGSVRAAVPYGPGAFAAIVRDATGKPVVGALVVAQGPTTRQGTTGLGGLIVVQTLPLGNYDVRVTSPGYAPTDLAVTVKNSGSSLPLLNLKLTTADLSSAGATATTLSTGADPADDPYVAHALAATPGVDIVPNFFRNGSAAVLDGTTPLETRAELDGIPLAGNFTGAAGLRFRNALALDAVDVMDGLASAPMGTPLDTIGGIVNYRTAPIGGPFSAGGEAGYDSSYGSFQRVRYSQSLANLSVLTNLVTGGGINRSQIVKARYALSGATSLQVSSYGSQSDALFGESAVSNIAPAYAVDLSTKLGAATLEARRYRSSSLTAEGDGDPFLSTDDSIAGTQVDLAIPSGEALVSLGYDGRREDAHTADVALARRYSTISAKADFPIARAARFELADAYGGGSQMGRRHSPHAALTLGAGERFDVVLSAGSAFATLPLDTLALLAPAARQIAPETSFGYRAEGDLKLDSQDRVWGSLFTLRRFDALAALSQADSRGIEVGFERTASRGLGALAYASLQRAYGYGAPQPYAYVFTFPTDTGVQLSGDAYSKARLALTYRLPNSVDLRVGTTFLGANNALATKAFALGDASLGISLGSLAVARIGVQNLFGRRIGDPALAPEYAPNEITFSLGRR